MDRLYQNYLMKIKIFDIQDWILNTSSNIEELISRNSPQKSGKLKSGYLKCWCHLFLFKMPYVSFEKYHGILINWLLTKKSEFHFYINYTLKNNSTVHFLLERAWINWRHQKVPIFCPGFFPTKFNENARFIDLLKVNIFYKYYYENL